MNKIYVFWTGTNDMSPNRINSLKSMSNSGCEIVLLNTSNLNKYINDDRLHPAYRYLNLAHKADYLRCYFMTKFGGGYCDIKEINDSWVDYFALLKSSSVLWGVGYKEVGAYGVAELYHSSKQLNQSAISITKSYLQWRFLQLNYTRLIGLCAFIFKPNNSFVDDWWSQLNKRLDYLLPSLVKNPSIYPKERMGMIYNGVKSLYPVPWSYLLGDIFHPLAFKYRKYLSKSLPPPNFNNYQ